MIMSMKSNTVIRMSGDINQSSHRHTVNMAFCFESGSDGPGPLESRDPPLPAADPDWPSDGAVSSERSQRNARRPRILLCKASSWINKDNKVNMAFCLLSGCEGPALNPVESPAPPLPAADPDWLSDAAASSERSHRNARRPRILLCKASSWRKKDNKSIWLFV